MATFQTRKTASGKARYRAIVRRAGYPPLSRTAGSLRAVRAWAREVEADLDAGRYQPAGDLTVGDLIGRYLATVNPARKDADRREQQLGEWRRLLGQYRLDAFRPAHIAQARDTLAAGRQPATVVRYLAALSHVFTLAVKDWQVVPDNPVRRILWPKEPRGRVRFLSDDERERLLSACMHSRNRDLYRLVSLALMTGCRRGELLGLTWSAVDLKRARLVLLETKNNERRQVPLIARAVEMLKRLRAERPGGGKVFPSSDQAIAGAWQTALRAARIKDFRFHDLRHTAASYLAMTGATTNEIAEILGHKTLSMVKRYAHLTTAHTAQVLERMGAEVFK